MKRIGIVTDIDGVLLRGAQTIKNVDQSILKIKKLDIPFFLMTNGGGKTEQMRTNALNQFIFNNQQILNYKQLIQCHTPFRDLEHYKNEYVLLGGNGDLISIAQNYGYKKAIHIRELYQLCPWLYGVYGIQETQENRLIKENLLNRFQMTDKQLQQDISIKAAMVWSDVDQFEIALQLFSDALASEDGKIANFDIKVGKQQNTKLYFSNDDLIYPNVINVPRQAGGVFKIALDSIFNQQFKRKLQSTVYGKPSEFQYKYAEKLVLQQNKDVQKIYMIGDNIESDIKGVNNMKKLKDHNIQWNSILVKSGIYKHGNTNDADYIVEDFNRAIDLILEIEKNN